MSPGSSWPPNSAIASATEAGMAITWPGMSRDWATISPRGLNRAQEKSCASLITGEWAVRNTAWRISRTIETSPSVTISRAMGSSDWTAAWILVIL